MFIGEILCIFSFIPVAGAVLSIVGLVFILLGLYTAGKTHANMHTAFIVTIINLVVGIIAIFVTPLDIVSTILDLVCTYLVCYAICDLLRDKGDHWLADTSISVWKMYLVCTILVLIFEVLSYIPILGLFAVVAMVVAAIVLIVACIRYLILLYEAYHSLQM